MYKKIGKALAQKRKEKKLTIEDISKQLFMKPIYVQMLEEGSIDSFPSRPQALGFLKNYADFLELDLTQFEQEPISSPVDSAPMPNTDQATPQENSDDEPQASTTLDTATEAETASETPAQQDADQIDPAYKENNQISIGERLRERRETLGASVEEVSKHLKIPAHYIRLIEKNEFDLFASPVQARGMMLSYAEFLSVDREWVLEKFGDRLHATFTENREVPGPYDQSNEAKKVHSLIWIWIKDVFTIDMFVVIVSILLVVGFGIWGIRRVVTTREELASNETYSTPTPVITPTATPVLENTPDANETPTDPLNTNGEGLNTLATATPIPQAPIGTTIRIQITSSQRTYLKVIVDGEEELKSRVKPNTDLYFFADNSVEIVSGNAAALTIDYNGTIYDDLGDFGEIYQATFFIDRIETPAPQPTITTTPIPTFTPQPTVEEQPPIE